MTVLITFCFVHYMGNIHKTHNVQRTSNTTNTNLAMNNKSFGTWNNRNEIRSYKALSQNIHSDTMLFLGSSEFDHGKNTIFHPRRFFSKQHISLMLIGHQYNQCLNQTITLGALSPKLKKRKVILIISPTWFYPHGVPSLGYHKVFSMSCYMAFMENKKIPNSQKNYVAKRTEALLANYHELLDKVKLCDNIYVYGKNTSKYKHQYLLIKHNVNVTEAKAAQKSLANSNIKKLKKYNGNIKNPQPLNWKKLTYEAISYENNHMNKHMSMSNERWSNNLQYKYSSSRNKYVGTTFRYSPEYSDLECFLNVCRSEKIKVMMMVLPLNGYWYDYCGLHPSARNFVSQRVSTLAAEYKARVIDFRSYDYKPYFLEDNVHPWGLGWLNMDKAVYKFYKGINNQPM